MSKIEQIGYKNIKQPLPDCTNIPVMLSDETMIQRYEKVIKRMNEEDIDTLIIYADLEHGSNFEYLCGFLPRFEEALLIMHRNGKNYMVMGNENLNKTSHARISAEAIHSPYFSLPNQPMGNHEDIKTILTKAGIKANNKIGIVGWKNFTSHKEDNNKLFDIPYYIVHEVMEITENKDNLINATHLFIGENGVRCIQNVNEIEHYEFGASLASDCILKTMNNIEEGVSEMMLGNILNAYGQKNSVVTIAASGERFINANIYPTQNTVKLGDPISLTVGYKGGLSSRTGYAIKNEKDLPEHLQDYLDVIVKPYYNSIVTWLENVHCGCTGNDVYQMIEDVLPKQTYHWQLCPGHLTSDEEWMSSPIYDGSTEILKSGMIFQLDIIPSVKGYAGTSAESTVILADNELKELIKKDAPELWKRMQNRIKYIENELQIKLHQDILPMCSTVAYLRPFLLNKDKAMIKN